MNDKRNKISKTLVTTQNPDAAIGVALSETKVESVTQVADELASYKAMMAQVLEGQKTIAENQAKILALQSTPKTRTVRVTATGEQVVSSGKRGKPPTAGLDDCRDADGKVRKVGVRAYASECSGDRVGTYVLASRGAIGSGRGETISKTAACPYDERQIGMINACSLHVAESFGLRFRLVAVTDATVKLVPARTLTELQAARVAPLLATVGLDADAWCKLRTTEDGTGDGEINAPLLPE